MEILDDVAEWDYGTYEGERSVETRERRPGWNLFTDGAPQGESPIQVCRRADRVITFVRNLDAEGDIAIFSHGQFERVLAARWVGLPIELAELFISSTGSVSILGYEHDDGNRPGIVLWNGN
jgi:broad specificity phosphatase PhoE